ncbi:MAG: CheR family methyltransferase [Thermoguttaceae bacterium]
MTEALAAIVGLGASAGGMAALKEFFSAMPPKTGIAFVVVMHLDPDTPSMLPELLAGLTGFAVLEAAENQAIEPDHVYIIPPGKNLLLDQRRVRLEPRTSPLPTAIDTFFRSLAEDRQEKAVAVVLSGGGSDGALGIREIKARGGLVLVQDPVTAEHGDMPQSAIATEMVDFVLPPREMPEFLLRYTKQPYVVADSTAPPPATWTADFLQDVLTLVDQRIGHDFRSYKESTLRRRIWRRMSLCQTQQPMEYVQVLRDNPAELDALARDLVISVTYFFRDPDAWQIVAEQVLPELIATRRPDMPLRLWIPGCSTGEEAYSLAILLLEQIEAHGAHRKIQVFATDINEHALEKARAGVYPETIAADVSPERLRRFFIKEGANYRVSKKVRECVVFATHNVVGDPAFSRMDLISCRNLLIYLDHEAQKRVMPVFHYALREGGFLILGGAESVMNLERQFQAVSPKWRIFRRIGASRAERVPPPFPLEPPSKNRIRPPVGLHPPARSLTEITQQLTLDRFGPASALVDRQYRVLVLCGPTDRFLRVPSGELDAELLSMVREGLRAKVRSALHEAAKDSSEVVQTGRVKRNGDYYQVQIVVTPVNVPDFQEGLFLVMFQGGTEVVEPAPEPAGPTSTEEQYVRQLERELQDTRVELNSTIEQLEGSNEELKASHEEAVSMNEELQSSNEELETSKEELQSLNEELTTLNNQLEEKVSQLEATTNDLDNLLTSTDIAALFLDTTFHIRQFTPAAVGLFHLIPSDVGRPIHHLAAQFSVADLVADGKDVLEKLVPKDQQVQTQDGRWYMRRTLPYRTRDNRIEGVVVTFHDVTQLKHVEEALRQSEFKLRRLFESDLIGILFAEGETVTDANDVFLKMVGYTREDLAAGRVNWRAMTPPEHRELDDRALEELSARGSSTPVEKEYIRKDGSRVPISIGAARLEQSPLRWVCFVFDITERRRAEQALRESEERLSLAIDAAHMGSFDWNMATNEILWTPYHEIIFGYPPGTPHRTYRDFAARVHPEDLPRVEEWMRQSQAEHKPYECSYRVVWPDGSVHWATGYGRFHYNAEGKAIRATGMVLDTTELKRAEQAVRRTVERLELLAEVSSQLLASDRPQEIVDSLCRRVMEHLDCQVFFNYLLDEQQNKLRLNSSEGVSAETAREIEWLEFGSEVCGCTACDPSGMAAKHIQATLQPRAELVRKLGFRAYACRPLLNQGRVIGTLSFGSLKRETFSEEDLGLIGAVADQVAIAMQRIGLMQSLEQRAAEAQSANVAKSQFLANMSHQLRTPMNAVLGMTDLALAEELSPTVRDYVDTARESAGALLELLNDILDLSRIEAGRLRLESAPFRLRPLLDKTVKSLGIRAYEKGLELLYDVADGVPDRLAGDALRVRQVLTNLVGNAIKYTHKGEITVRVAVRSQSDREACLEFLVQDTGIGISPEDQQKLFVPFEQPGAPITRGREGSGLGLSISARLVDLMGGRIWVESQLGKGSEFHFTVCMPLAAETGALEQDNQHLLEAVRDVSTLVVAENATSRLILSQTMLRWSMRAETAASVPEALMRIHKAVGRGQKFQVVIADAILPEIDGFTLANWVKSGSLAGPVILMLSAVERHTAAVRCKEAGVLCMEKPLAPDDLLRAIGKVLGINGQTAAAETVPQAEPGQAPPRRTLRILLAEDSLPNQKLILYALGQRGHKIVVAGNGAETLDLIQRQDFDLVLMDVQMPLMDGIEATAAIRKLDDPKKAKLPIIAMTAHAYKSDQERCLAAGMDAYISKPVNRQELIEMVERIAGE